MRCPRCDVDLVPGQALQNTLVAGLPDFPGQTDIEGQTLSPGGPGRLVDVRTCPDCGYSVSGSVAGLPLP